MLFRENFNQFNQCIVEETSIPRVMPVYKPEHDESKDIDRYISMLGSYLRLHTRVFFLPIIKSKPLNENRLNGGV